MHFSPLGVFIVSVKPLTTEKPEKKTKFVKLHRPQKLLPTHLALWCMYNHPLRDVRHFGKHTNHFLLIFSAFLFFFSVPSRACESNVFDIDRGSECGENASGELHLTSFFFFLLFLLLLFCLCLCLFLSLSLSLSFSLSL